MKLTERQADVLLDAHPVRPRSVVTRSAPLAASVPIPVGELQSELELLDEAPVDRSCLPRELREVLEMRQPQRYVDRSPSAHLPVHRRVLSESQVVRPPYGWGKLVNT
jgi:hypothetical protein